MNIIGVPEAAQILGVSNEAVIYHISKGNLPKRKVAGRYLLTKDEVLRMDGIATPDFPTLFSKKEAIRYLDMNNSERHYFNKYDARRLGFTISGARIYTKDELDRYSKNQRKRGRPVSEMAANDLVYLDEDGLFVVGDTEYKYKHRQHALWRARQLINVEK